MSSNVRNLLLFTAYAYRMKGLGTCAFDLDAARVNPKSDKHYEHTLMTLRPCLAKSPSTKQALVRNHGQPNTGSLRFDEVKDPGDCNFFR